MTALTHDDMSTATVGHHPSVVRYGASSPKMSPSRLARYERPCADDGLKESVSACEDEIKDGRLFRLGLKDLMRSDEPLPVQGNVQRSAQACNSASSFASNSIPAAQPFSAPLIAAAKQAISASPASCGTHVRRSLV